MIWGNSYGSRKNTSCETGIIQRYLSARSTTKTLVSIWQNIGQSHALAIRHFVDIVSPTFELGLPCLQSNSLSASSYECSMSIPHTHLQKLVHVMANFYHGSGKQNFLDWIISATIHLENPANKGSLSGNINYRVSFSMSNMSPTSLINLYLACSALGTDEKSN